MAAITREGKCQRCQQTRVLWPWVTDFDGGPIPASDDEMSQLMRSATQYICTRCWSRLEGGAR